jgi:hypothetical protein
MGVVRTSVKQSFSALCWAHNAHNEEVVQQAWEAKALPSLYANVNLNTDANTVYARISYTLQNPRNCVPPPLNVLHPLVINRVPHRLSGGLSYI